MSFKISATFLQFFDVESSFWLYPIVRLVLSSEKSPAEREIWIQSGFLGELAHLYCTYRTIIVQQVSKNKNYKIENKFMVFERELLKHSDE